MTLDLDADRLATLRRKEAAADDAAKRGDIAWLRAELQHLLEGLVIAEDVLSTFEVNKESLTDAWLVAFPNAASADWIDRELEKLAPVRAALGEE
jgi:hypothetical protein